MIRYKILKYNLHNIYILTCRISLGSSSTGLCVDGDNLFGCCLLGKKLCGCYLFGDKRAGWYFCVKPDVCKFFIVG